MVAVFFAVLVFYFGVFAFAFSIYAHQIKKVSGVFKEKSVYFFTRVHYKKAFFDALLWPVHIFVHGFKAWWNEFK